MMTSSSSSSGNHLNVFTAAQWEELEQQALIYKYMVSGVPVPTDLILSVRRSLYNSTFSSPAASLSTQPTLGVWDGSYQYNQLYHQLGGVGGYGRKVDLEPGRCRRTDGKKWRCAKEAYPDSKYCERHMHRGRNRSRKPVEFSASSSSSSSAASSSTATTVNVSASPAATLSKSVDTYPSFSSIQTGFMDASSYSNQAQKDYRYMQGLKALGEDDRSTYFHLNDPFNTQKMSATAAASSSDHHNYSHFSFQNLKDQQQQRKNEETQGQHCFVMGADFIKSSEETAKSHMIQIGTKAEETAAKQPFHHFFSAPKTTPNNPNHDANWVDAPKSPLSTQELFQSKPRPYW